MTDLTVLPECVIPVWDTDTDTDRMTTIKTSNIFVQVLKDYMIQTTLHGYQYLTEPRRHWCERLTWTAVNIAITLFLSILVYGMCVEYYDQLPVTTIKTIYHPIKEVPYPAVAICDINKLDKSRTMELASVLYAGYNFSVSEERLGELLHYLGLLYYQSEQRNSETGIRELQKVLTEANVTLNIPEEMRRLSTPCNETLVTCQWKGQIGPCKDMFQTRLTMEGYCCTFNYVRPTDTFNAALLTTDSAKPPETTPTSGPHMGLTVLVRSNLTDYYYPTIPVYGLKVLIFNPYDYPDTGSGGLTELLVPMKQEMFFTMSAVTTVATKMVRHLNLHRRSCYFQGDNEDKFGDLYSYSDCLMHCRIDDIRKKCGCLPFYVPSGEETPICGVQNVLCLLSNRDIWETLRPRSLSAKETVFSGNVCPSPCYPTCTSTLYTVQSSSMLLSQEQIDKSNIYPTVDIKNHSLVHIYFGSPSGPLMLTDVLTTWFELLSDVGGVCGVFVGFSLMSIIEFIYFFTVRLAFQAFYERRQEREKNKHEDTPVSEKSSEASTPSPVHTWTDVYHKKKDPPRERENGYRRTGLYRSSTVHFFWSEISHPKNSGRRVYDTVY